MINDASTDGTVDVLRELATRYPAVRWANSHLPPGFGHAIRAGLDLYEGDAVAIMMADMSSSPSDLASYYRLLEAGYDCAFGTRFGRGGNTYDYPKFKLLLNRVANAGIRMLFRHGYNDTTNAFKAYRREVIDQVQPLLSNHFNLHRRDPVESDSPWLQLRGRAGQLGQPDTRCLKAARTGDGQPLRVHRALHLARATSESR